MSVSKQEALKQADVLLARMLSPYSMIWSPVLRRNIKRVRRLIAASYKEPSE